MLSGRSIFGNILKRNTPRGVLSSIRSLSFPTLTTPNEDALKFTSPECEIVPVPDQTFEFTTTMQAIHSPLALRIFNIPGVRSVMLGQEFLTVNKQDYVDWATLKPEVIQVLDKFLTEKKEPVITKELLQENDRNTQPNEDDLEAAAMVKELIQTRIRPAIQDDGGDIEYRAIDEETGKVFIKLRGACKSCSSSEDTLKSGIEGMLMHYIEGITEVVQVLDPEEEIAMKEFDKLEQDLKRKKENQSETPPPSL